MTYEVLKLVGIKETKKTSTKMKKKFKDTKVGKFLSNIGKLNIVGAVGEIATGDVLGAVEKLLRNSNELTPEQREVALELVKLDMQAQKDVTERWKYDMSSDSLLSKNIRPMALIFLTVSTVLIAIADSMGWSFEVDSAWVDLLKTLLITVYTAYFAGRSFEKLGKKL